MAMYRPLAALLLLMLWAGCAAREPETASDRTVRQNTYYHDRAASLFVKGCYAQALSYFQNAHERFSATDDPAGIANSVNSMANIYYRLGDMDGALRLYNDAIESYRHLKDRRGMVRAMSNKAAALIAAGKPTQARSVLDEADALAEDGHLLAALRLKNRALLRISEGDAPGAELLLKKALDEAGRANTATTAGIYYALGRLRLPEQPDQARPLFEKALALDKKRGAYADTAKDLEGLGTCYAQNGHDHEAVDYFKRSAKIFALLQDGKHVQSVVARMQTSAQQSGIDIQPTLHWIGVWLAGRTEANICR